jgi:CRISPR-associated protein Csy2
MNDKISIEIFSNDSSNLRIIKRKLLPGFVLMDRAGYLQEHYEALCQINPDTELLNAWMDFSALKKIARPKSDLISKYLLALSETHPEDAQITELQSEWQQHLKAPYLRDSIPSVLIQYFSNLEQSKSNKNLLQQWQDYFAPNEKSDADWESIPKPKPGYLVPIMTGYKAISPVYPAGEVKNTRDTETPVCFVESVHSVGEWKGVHRVKDFEDLNACLWHYHQEEHWYLCKQFTNSPINSVPPTPAEADPETESELNFY